MLSADQQRPTFRCRFNAVSDVAAKNPKVAATSPRQLYGVPYGNRKGH